MCSIQGHESDVMCVDFSRDGSLFVSGGDDDDPTLRLWTLMEGESPKLQQTLTGHTHTVRAVKFSPDGQQIASASYDGTVMLWSVESGELLLTLTDNEGHLYGVAWSPDGKQVACCGHSGIRIRETATGIQVREDNMYRDKHVTCIPLMQTYQGF
jgi:WD40 repeat protein